MSEKKPRTTPQKTSWMLMGSERVTWPKTQQTIYDDNDVDDVYY
jgi:hypothetical protein